MMFHEKLQRLRKANGLSQEQLAEKLDVSRQAVSKWETGTVPDRNNLLKISRFFHCSLDALMDDEADEIGEKTPGFQENAQAAPKKRGLRAFSVAGAAAAALGAVGILLIGIFSSVYPAVVYDPPQGEVRAILETGLGAFLKVHNLTWLFLLCVGLVSAGILTALFPSLRRFWNGK